MESFGAVTRDLLIEQGMVTPIGNANWAVFAHDLEGVSYETLRKAVSGEREPSAKLMETVAAALGVDPTVYTEYQLEEARRSFDPSVVGEEQALENLKAWSATQAIRAPRFDGKASHASAAMAY